MIVFRNIRFKPLVFTLLLGTLLILSMFAVLPLGSSAESLNAWNATTNFPRSTPSTSCVTWQGYVYCIDDGQAFFAPISSSGVGTWSATTSYPIYISETSCVASGGYIYCISGYPGGSGPTSAEYYASLSSSGIGPWSLTGTSGSYPFAMDLSCVTANSYVYCVGGTQAVGAVQVPYVSFAPLSSAGIGTWQSTTQYPFAVAYQSCAISANYVYCVGGFNSTLQYQNAVYYAPISSSGVGGWKHTSAYPMALGFTSCVVSSGNLYCVGGEGSNSNTADVFYSTPSSSGGLGDWKSTTSYPTAISYEACVSSGGYIYCIAGVDSNYSNAVYYTSVASSTSSQLTVTSQNTSGKTINGYYTTLYSSSGQVLSTGFTPATFTLNNGQSYSVRVSNYGSCHFVNWLDGSTSNPRSISITNNTQLTAVYNCGSRGSSVTVKSVNQNGNAIAGYYTVLYSSSGSVIATGFTPKTFSTTSGQSYSVRASSYRSCIFSHWSNGATSNPMPFTATSSAQTFTAVYNCGTSGPSSVTINSVNQNGNTITGYYTVLYNSGGSAIGTGFTPKTFPTTSGQTYSVRASSYRSCIFSHWSNGATSDPMPFTATSSAQTFTAVYNCG